MITGVVPYLRNEVFVSREPVIQKLRDRILPIGESHTRVALFGLGGVGYVYLPRVSVNLYLTISLVNRKSLSRLPINCTPNYPIYLCSGSMQTASNDSEKDTITSWMNVISRVETKKAATRWSC